MNTRLMSSIAMAMDNLPDADLYAIHISAALYGRISSESSAISWLRTNSLVDDAGLFKYPEETISAVTAEISRRKG